MRSIGFLALCLALSATVEADIDLLDLILLSALTNPQGYGGRPHGGYGGPHGGYGGPHGGYGPNYGHDNCYGISKKKVSHGHMSGYKYSYGDKSYHYGHYKKRCSKIYHQTSHKYQCPKQSWLHGYGGYNVKCHVSKCDLYVTEGWSKCHGKVKLSHPYRHWATECTYHGQSCGQQYHGHSSGHGTGYGNGYGNQGYSASGYSNYGQGNSGSYDGGGGAYPAGAGVQTRAGWQQPSYKHYKPPPPPPPKCHCQSYSCKKTVEACYDYGGYYYIDDVQIYVPCGCYCVKAKQYGYSGGW